MPREYKKFDLSDYEITKNGEVYNRHNGKQIKPQPNGKGYLRFWVGGKYVFVHRVVASLYVPNPENKSQVNHKDGNKLNNCANNLEWVTNQENRNHAVKMGLQVCGERCSYAKLNQSQVDFIRTHTEIKAVDLAELFGVTAATIRNVRSGKTWKIEKIC